MSNCVNDENDDRIVTLCDMTGTFHTFNIGIDETFEILGEKVKEKLELEKNKYDIYFFPILVFLLLSLLIFQMFHQFQY